MPWKVFPCHMHLMRRQWAVGEEERPEWCEWAKIGGWPHWIQHEPRDYGRFLAAFASVAWLGEPDSSDAKVRHLDFFDGGLLNLCLLPDGHVGEHFQCY
jgi:hypothetical protein